MLPQPNAATAAPRPIVPAERIAAIIEVILCSGFPTQLLLIGIVHGLGMPIQLDGGGFNPMFVFSVSMADAVLVIALVALLLRAHHESVRDVLIGRVQLLRETWVGITLVPAVFLTVAVIVGLILQFAPQLHNVPRNPLEDMLRDDRDAAIFAVVVIVAGGVREEVQRGFIIHRFRQYLGGGLVGVAVYSVLFGLGHYEQGYDASIATGVLGAIWGLVYLRRGSIVAPVVSHAGFNLAQVIKYVALR